MSLVALTVRPVLRSLTVLLCILLAGPSLAQSPQLPRLSSIEVVPSIGHNTSITGVSVSPDGRFIVSGGADFIKIWEGKSGRLVRTLPEGLQITSTAVFMPDSIHIATASEDGKVRLWNAETGAIVREFAGHTDILFALAVSPDGRRIVSGGRDKTVRVWDAGSGNLLRTFDQHTEVIGRNALATDGRVVVSADKNGALVWDIESGQVLQKLQDAGKLRPPVALSADGKDVLVASENGARAYDRQTGKLVRAFEGHKDKGIAWIGFSPDGKLVVTGGRNYTIRIWDRAKGALKAEMDGLEFEMGFGAEINRAIAVAGNGLTSATFAPDSRTLVTSNFGAGKGGPKLKMWNLSSGKLAGEIRGSRTEFRPITAAARPDEYYLLSTTSSVGSDDVKEPQSIVSRFDTNSGELSVFDVRSGYSRKDGLSFRDGKLYLAGLNDLLKIDPATKQAEKTTSLADEGSKTSFDAVSTPIPQSSRIAVAVDQDRIELRDEKGAQPARTLTGLGGECVAIVTSPDGQLLVAGTKSGRIVAWSLRDEKKLIEIGAFDDAIASLAASNDGRIAASARFEIGIWSVASSAGNLLQTLKGHRRIVLALAFSPDGKLLVSGGADRIANIWNVGSGKLERRIEGHSAAVEAVRVSADGRHFISTADDGSVRVYELSSGRLLTTTYAFHNGGWVTMTPEGFFNASSPEESAKLTIVEKLNVYSIDQFRDSLYRPDLVREKLAGDPQGKVREAATRLDLTKAVASGNAPRVTIAEPATGAGKQGEQVTLEAEVIDQGGGIARVEWRVNGVTLGVEERGVKRITEPAASSSAPALGQAGQGRTIKVSRTLGLTPGENRIAVIAYNEAGVTASAPAEIVISSVQQTASKQPRLYVLTVGVNDYWDSALKLSYAAPDARRIADGLKQAGGKLYEQVEVKTVLDGEATAEKLDGIFTELGKKVRPQDVFVFFLAGHGKTVDARFYFLPQDFRYAGEDSIVKKGVGQNQLQDWVSRIKAQKSVLLFDACESGSLVGDRIAMRGIEEKTAIDRMTRAMGRTVLTATTDSKPAIEGYRGHGVFTYTLLAGFEAADANADGVVDVTELATYVDRRLPDLTYAAFKLRQVPQMSIVGSNFPLASKVALLPADGAGPAASAPGIPAKPTHVVIAPADVYEQLAGKGNKVEQLPPGALVSLVKTEQGWVLVARDGKAIGYVAENQIARMQ